MREKLKTQTEDEGLDVRCTFCTRSERVTSFSSIQRGNHIYMGGDKFMQNIFNRQVAWYTHHAIVKEVKLVTCSTAILTLIHFISTPYDNNIEIRETTELKDLNYDEIYVVRYRHKTHPVEKIISRAEKLITDNVTYSFLSGNCEHICHHCCAGNKESHQVDNFIQQLKSSLASMGTASGKIIFLKNALKLIPLSLRVKMKLCVLTGVPCGVFVVLSIVYLIYYIYRHLKLNKALKQGNICSACCSSQKSHLWCTFGIYCLTQVGGLALLYVVTAASVSSGVPCVGIVAVFVLTLLSVWAVNKLKAKLSSPFHGNLIRLETMKSIHIGDVISYDHWRISHDGIVSAVHIYSGTDNKKGKIKVIHYSLPQLLGRRKVFEESMEVDLTKDLIKAHDYSGLKVHSPERVVQRARQRIGETKFGLLSNRSCHFCHWAKLDEETEDEPSIAPDQKPVLKFEREIELQESLSELPQINVDHRRRRKHATMRLEIVCAHIREDLKVGYIIQFKYRCFSHKAVITSVDYDLGSQSKLVVAVVHYAKEKVVTEERFSFDLNHDDILIYKYHPLYRFNKTDVIRRAKARIGDKSYNFFKHRSTHLAEEIVMKNRDTPINDMDDIHSGDVIIYNYWSFNHAAIVTSVRKNESKANNIGKVTIIHYALDHLFAKRTVREEEIPIDLSKEHVYVRSFDGYIAYSPEKSVIRARTRVGEELFWAFGNNSWDLVYWAKIVQSPAVVTMSVEGHDNQSPNRAVKRRLLVPKTGKHYGKLQRIQVYVWSDLTPGVIVDFKYYKISHQGILTEADEASKTIKVVHYGTDHIFATRTIMEETLNVDLKHDDLWIYRCHPSSCNTPEDVIRNARLRIGEQKWQKGNRSEDFCKTCVLNDEARGLTTLKCGEFQRIQVHAWSDLTPGVIVDFKYYKISHQGILTEADEASKTIKVVHYGTDHIFATRTIMEETLNVDLKHDDLWIYRCHPSSCNTPEDVIRNARLRIGEQKWQKGNRSEDFCKTCVLNDEARGLTTLKCGEFQRIQVHAWSDLNPGVIIDFKYYMILHQGILTMADEASKTIKVVHYGTDHIFTTRTIMEETLNVDLKHDAIWINRCHPSSCNTPEDIIRKAQSRIGEHDWRKGNRSEDFCKQCVLRN